MLFASLPQLKAQHAFIEQGLSDELSEADDQTLIAVLAMLSDRVDYQALKRSMDARGLSAKERPREVLLAAAVKAETSGREVAEFLFKQGLSPSEVMHIRISNTFAFTANKAVIEALASHRAVERMTLDIRGGLLIEPEILPVSEAKSQGGSEPGLTVIGLPELWEMGYTGNGRLAMTFDTGVWPDHPALADRFLPNMMPISQTWFGYDSPLPVDKTSSHGTHVSGTMVGLDPATADTIGGAFKAYLIATDPVVSNLAFVKPLSDFMFGYEWALNPDGDENTTDDVPDVINNSWGFGPDLDEAPCPEFVVPVFDAVEAAGIANVFSAGNEGPEPFTMSVPHNINTGLVNSFTVGAVNGNVAGPDYPIAEFSSRGPSLCGGEGSLLIKPEVSAPGVNVRSSTGSGEYQSFSGTSMASPHVSAAVLLLKEAFPDVTGEEILLALYYSATDLGEPGEDNTFGMGLINAKAAFDYLSEAHDPAQPAVPEHDLDLVSADAPLALFRCTADGQTEITPEITVHNKGTEPALGIEIRYTLTGSPEQVWSDPSFALAPDQTVSLSLPPIAAVSPGFTELHLRITPHPDEYDVFNNNAVRRWTQLPVPTEGLDAFTEDFQTGFDPELWTVINPDLDITWDTVAALRPDGETGLTARMRFGSYAPAAGQRDYLAGPMIFPEGQSQYSLTFDYFYRRRTNNPNNFDTLAVSLAHNCGDSFFELWREGGENLYTNDVHMPNAMPESTDDWAAITLPIDLNDIPDFAAEDGFFPVFTGINRRGNTLLIGNVSLDYAASTRRSAAPVELTLAPNPARTEVRITWSGSEQNGKLTLYDMRGTPVASHPRFTAGTELSLAGIASGIYIAEVLMPDGGRSVAKLTVY